MLQRRFPALGIKVFLQSSLWHIDLDIRTLGSSASGVLFLTKHRIPTSKLRAAQAILAHAIFFAEFLITPWAFCHIFLVYLL
jgi:hypothetical protein